MLKCLEAGCYWYIKATSGCVTSFQVSGPKNLSPTVQLSLLRFPNPSPVVPLAFSNQKWSFVAIKPQATIQTQTNSWQTNLDNPPNECKHAYTLALRRYSKTSFAASMIHNFARKEKLRDDPMTEFTFRFAPALRHVVRRSLTKKFRGRKLINQVRLSGD